MHTRMNAHKHMHTHLCIFLHHIDTHTLMYYSMNEVSMQNILISYLFNKGSQQLYISPPEGTKTTCVSQQNN